MRPQQAPPWLCCWQGACKQEAAVRAGGSGGWAAGSGREGSSASGAHRSALVIVHKCCWHQGLPSHRGGGKEAERPAAGSNRRAEMHSDLREL